MEMDLSGSDEMLGPSDDEEETVTALEVLEKLTNGWRNEKLSPELLPPLTEEVECMLEQLRAMEDNLSKCQPRDEIIKHHQLEVERIRYLVADYLRVRLAKIQKYSWHIRDEERKRRVNEPPRLMPEEHKFLVEYLNIVEAHLSSVALQNMPRGLDTLQRIKVVPNMDTFVFFRMKNDASVVVEDADGEKQSDVSLKIDSQYIMKYTPVSALVISNDAQLV